MAGHVGVSGVYKKSGKEIAKGGNGGIRWKWKQRACLSLFQVLLKLTVTYGQEEPADSQLINEWGGAWVVPGPGEGGWSCP
jgi:hypothetical protein